MLTATTLFTLAIVVGATPPSTPLVDADGVLVDRDNAPYFLIEDPLVDVESFPLESVHTDVHVAGVIADVTLKQRYRNRGRVTIEATYVFPASTRAAVHGVTMRVGDRVFNARLRKKSEATTIYDDARRTGTRAALLEEHRRNVFQMSVANIRPNDVIEIDVHYSELIVPEEGVYAITVPAVVGPRFLDRTATDADAALFTNPVMPMATVSRPAFSANLQIASPLDVQSLSSPTHALAPKFHGRRRADVHVSDVDDAGAGARDLVVRYVLGGKRIETGVLTYRDKEHGENYFLLLAEPPRAVTTHEIPARELVFIVDVSGSMSGFPTEVTRDVLTSLLDTLGPHDRFNVVTFAGASSLYAEESVPATAAHRVAAQKFANKPDGGGTDLKRALERAFALPAHRSSLSRSFIVLTDGYVAADHATLHIVRERLHDANVFVFGIGTSVNRSLIEDIARAGQGEPFFALKKESGRLEVERFTRLLARPALTDVRVRFESFDVYDLEPPKIPDLFAERPIVLFGKYRNSTGGRITIEGQSGHGQFSQAIPVEDSRESNDHAAIRILWARARLDALRAATEPSVGRDEEATAIALEHDLLSPHTSFVVVDDGEQGDVASTTIRQPLPIPDGVVRARPVVNVRASMSSSTTESAGNVFGAGGLGVSGVGRGAGGLGAKSERDVSLNGAGGVPTVSGAVDVNAMKRVFRSKQSQLKYCFERERAKSPSLSGRVDVRLEIDDAGRTSRVSFPIDQVGSPPLLLCFEKMLQRTRFPAPTGGGTVVLTVPLVFDASEAVSSSLDGR